MVSKTQRFGPLLRFARENLGQAARYFYQFLVLNHTVETEKYEVVPRLEDDRVCAFFDSRDRTFEPNDKLGRHRFCSSEGDYASGFANPFLQQQAGFFCA